MSVAVASLLSVCIDKNHRWPVTWLLIQHDCWWWSPNGGINNYITRTVIHQLKSVSYQEIVCRSVSKLGIRRIIRSTSAPITAKATARCYQSTGSQGQVLSKHQYLLCHSARVPTGYQMELISCMIVIIEGLNHEWYYCELRLRRYPFWCRIITFWCSGPRSSVQFLARPSRLDSWRGY